jgi:hypothetical protein
MLRTMHALSLNKLLLFSMRIRCARKQAGITHDVIVPPPQLTLRPRTSWKNAKTVRPTVVFLVRASHRSYLKAHMCVSGRAVWYMNAARGNVPISSHHHNRGESQTSACKHLIFTSRVCVKRTKVPTAQTSAKMAAFCAQQHLELLGCGSSAGVQSR